MTKENIFTMDSSGIKLGNCCTEEVGYEAKRFGIRKALVITDKKIEKLSQDQFSEPIKVNNSYLIIKVNQKKELKNKVNLEKELEKLINLETNRQLNNFSIIFYKRLRKNIEIYEY